MEDRIKKFMEYKGITPSELADSIGVQRSNVTHVLHGRNNPSLPFIEKMLECFPELNAEWFMRGKGNMINDHPKSKTLFDEILDPGPVKIPSKVIVENPITELPIAENTDSNDQQQKTIEYQQTAIVDKDSKIVNQRNDERNTIQDQFFSAEKPIERIIVFFTDQSFKVYNPSR